MWQASNAAFTSTTANGANSFSTGSVVISSNPGSALFNLTGLKPGDTGAACITVTYSGSLAANVRLYATSPSTTNSLSSYITLQIEQSSGNSTITAPACTSFSTAGNIYNSTMDSFGSTYTNFGGGIAAWSPTGASSRDYRITYTLSGSAPNTTQSSSAAVTFTWEAQNQP